MHPGVPEQCAAHETRARQGCNHHPWQLTAFTLPGILSTKLVHATARTRFVSSKISDG
ncbi:hypothetical protein BVI434_160005 [Burkholderia vietnamiensis]|nr:hypothetical protein BVI434_160005 [Burkholderia vietnamiensis]